MSESKRFKPLLVYEIELVMALTLKFDVNGNLGGNSLGNTKFPENFSKRITYFSHIHQIKCSILKMKEKAAI